MYMVCAINFCQNLLKISKFFFVKQERQLLQQEFFNKNVIFLYSSFFFQTPHKTFFLEWRFWLFLHFQRNPIYYMVIFSDRFFFLLTKLCPLFVYIFISLSCMAVSPWQIMSHSCIYSLIASQVGAFTHLIKFWCNLYVFSVFLYQCIFNEK